MAGVAWGESLFACWLAKGVSKELELLHSQTTGKATPQAQLGWCLYNLTAGDQMLEQEATRPLPPSPLLPFIFLSLLLEAQGVLEPWTWSRSSLFGTVAGIPRPSVCRPVSPSGVFHASERRGPLGGDFLPPHMVQLLVYLSDWKVYIEV